MISPKVHVLTFTGSGSLQALTSGSSNRATKVIAQPLRTNTNPAYVGTVSMAIGTSLATGVISEIAAPVAATPLDKFSWDVKAGHDLIDMNQLYFDGASGEKLLVTVFVG